MTLYFHNPGDLRSTVVNYLKGVLEDFPEVTTGRSMIPDNNNIFQVISEDKQTLLKEERAT